MTGPDATTCTTTIRSALDTGSTSYAGWAVAAALLIVTVALVWRLARRRRAIGAVLGVTLVAGLLLTAPEAPSARAADPIEYGGDCTLLDVDGAAARWTTGGPGSDALVPGQSVTVLEVSVGNAFSRPITLAGTLGVDATALGLRGQVRFDSASGPARLASGRRTTVTLTVGLPASADNRMQGTTVPLELVLTASEAR